MALKDLAPGDLLYKILNPRANEVRLDRTEREISRLKKRSYRPSPRGSGSGSGGSRPEDSGGGNSRGISDRVPAPDILAVSIQTTSKFSGDGAYQPTITITEPTRLHEQIRGFNRYRARLVYASGKIEEIDGRPIHDGDPTVLGVALSPDNGGSYFSVQLQAVSEIYGVGPWSEARAISVSDDTTVPPTPSAPTLSAKVGAIVVTFSIPSLDDYKLTQIWKGTGDFTLGGFSVGVLAGESSTGLCEIAWDERTSLDGAYDTIKIRTVDRSGNASDLSSGTTVNGTMKEDVKLDVVNTRFLMSASDPLAIYDQNGLLIAHALVDEANGLVDWRPAGSDYDDVGFQFRSRNSTGPFTLVAVQGTGLDVSGTLHVTSDADFDANVNIDGDLVLPTGDITAVNILANGYLDTTDYKYGTRSWIGTSFPGSPVTNQFFYRTDLGVWCYYNGSHWVGPKQEKMVFIKDGAPTNYSGTTFIGRHVPFASGNYWLSDVNWRCRVSTTNNALNYWTLRIGYEGYTFGGAAILDVNTIGLTVDQYGEVTGNAAQQRNYTGIADAFTFFTEVRKDNGAPGNIDVLSVNLVVQRIYT